MPSNIKRVVIIGSAVVQEPGRLFCPHCGNSTLEKVEAVIGPDGTEQYGVRKRFNTRGTRYSLPKPKVQPLHHCLASVTLLIYTTHLPLPGCTQENGSCNCLHVSVMVLELL